MSQPVYESDLFRFVHLRHPKPPKTTAPPVPPVIHTDTPEEGTFIEVTLLDKGKSTLVTTINTWKEEYYSNKAKIKDENAIEVALPGILKLMQVLDTKTEGDINYDTANVLILSHLGEVGDTLTDIVADTAFGKFKIQLWDNLFYNLFMDTVNDIFPAKICQCLATLNMIEVMAIDIPEVSIFKLYNARVAIPDWVYDEYIRQHQEANSHNDDEVNVAPATPSNELANIIRYTFGALEEIPQKLQDQIDAAIDADIIPDFIKLAPEYVALLSEHTLDLLDEKWNISPDNPLHVPRIMERLKGFLNQAMAQPNAPKFGETKSLKLGNHLIQTGTLCADIPDTDPCVQDTTNPFTTHGTFYSRLFVGELLVTKQYLVKYEANEVAHVENVLAGETKTRTFRRLNRTETTNTTEIEITNEQERESQTTERFSMEKETSNTVSQEMQLDAGVNTSGVYGITTVNTSVGFSFGAASSYTSQEATAFSKEVTSRALSRVKKRVRETKTVTVINETEDTAVHSLNGGSANANGVYRWLEKRYLNKIYSYGVRTMMEFMVPEPANFYIFRKMLSKQTEQKTIPTHPKDAEIKNAAGVIIPRLNSFKDISESNYNLWAAQYGVTGITPPPPNNVIISTAVDIAVKGDADATKIIDNLTIPKGYTAFVAYSQVNFIDPPLTGVGSTGTLMVQIGSTKSVHHCNGSGFPSPSNQTGFYPVTLAHTLYSNLVGVGNIDGGNSNLFASVKVFSNNTTRSIRGIVNIEVICMCTTQYLEEWKIGVYDKIIAAYQQQLRDYENWLSNVSFTAQIEGNNPSINRQIEKEELKKRCIELVSGQRFNTFGAATTGHYNGTGYPEIQFQKAINEGIVAKYYEQVFEWENMSYVFYPYYYGRKKNWLAITALTEENDPVFEKFLRAGYARVIVPLRPGFEEYAMSLLGLLMWQRESSPTRIPIKDSPTYWNIVNEIQAGLNVDPENLVDADSLRGHYMHTVPTNLVYLMPTPEPPAAPDSDLPDNSADTGIADYV